MLIVISFNSASTLNKRTRVCPKIIRLIYYIRVRGGGERDANTPPPIFLSHFLCVTDFLNMDITKSRN